MRCVLDADPELAEGLPEDTRRIARAGAVAVTFEADRGELRLAPWFDLVGSGLGLLLLDGVMAVNVQTCDRLAAELVGAGDLLVPGLAAEDDLVSCTARWHVLTPTRMAVLDEAFTKRIRFWPTLTTALLRRVARRNHDLCVQRAIAAQPRLEVRLALLLWHLSTRWGRVETGGIRLPLPLTHHLLGRLVAAERPSVSHALSRLAQAGLVSGQGDEWHLHGTLEQHLTSMLEPDAGHLQAAGGRAL
jgi:CRP/FNR family transcriptional regulator, cyclic AMP receptor protein